MALKILITPIFLFAFVVALPLAEAQLISPIKSTLPGVSLPNAHLVGQSGFIFRSMQPMEHLEELEQLGIDEVLIFKNQTQSEVDEEKIILKSDFKMRVHHIAFPWKNFASMEEGCKQMLAGLKIIKRAQEKGKKLLFHCTVGEDRTGALAGLWILLEKQAAGQFISTREVFRKEMCARGYSDGNAHKPSKVTEAIEKELTPLFFALAKKIEQGSLDLNNLNIEVCQNISVRSNQTRCR